MTLPKNIIKKARQEKMNKLKFRQFLDKYFDLEDVSTKNVLIAIYVLFFAILIAILILYKFPEPQGI